MGHNFTAIPEGLFVLWMEVMLPLVRPSLKYRMMMMTKLIRDEAHLKRKISFEATTEQSFFFHLNMRIGCTSLNCGQVTFVFLIFPSWTQKIMAIHHILVT